MWWFVLVLVWGTFPPREGAGGSSKELPGRSLGSSCVGVPFVSLHLKKSTNNLYGKLFTSKQWYVNKVKQLHIVIHYAHVLSGLGKKLNCSTYSGFNFKSGIFSRVSPCINIRSICGVMLEFDCSPTPILLKTSSTRRAVLWLCVESRTCKKQKTVSLSFTLPQLNNGVREIILFRLGPPS